MGSYFDREGCKVNIAYQMQLDSNHARLFNLSMSRDLGYTNLYECSLGSEVKSISTKFPFKVDAVMIPSANCAAVKTVLQRP